MNRRTLLLPVILLLATGVLTAQTTSTAPPAAAPAPVELRHADHEELRAMMKAVTAALNSHTFDGLDPFFGEKCYITTLDGQTFNNGGEFKTYLQKLYATAVRKIEFHPEADELTWFLNDDTALSRGSSVDTYTFVDGDVRTMKSRWSATLHRESGRWKVVSLHISANVLDNPVVASLHRLTWIVGIAALVAGLVIGFLVRGKRN